MLRQGSKTISSKGSQTAAQPNTEQTNESKVSVNPDPVCILDASLQSVLHASISMRPARGPCPPSKSSTAATALASCHYPFGVPNTNSAVTAPCSQKMGPYSGPISGTFFAQIIWKKNQLRGKKLKEHHRIHLEFMSDLCRGGKGPKPVYFLTFIK